jgi:hypothetical protein
VGYTDYPFLEDAHGIQVWHALMMSLHRIPFYTIRSRY